LLREGKEEEDAKRELRVEGGEGRGEWNETERFRTRKKERNKRTGDKFKRHIETEVRRRRTEKETERSGTEVWEVSVIPTTCF
jgi:hypothetical protein